MSRRHSSGDGDWVCADAKCGNVNFSRRHQCNRCGAEKSHVTIKAGGSAIGKQLAEKSKGLFSADDWQCKTCGNVNWARRNDCNLCKAPKFGKVEARTGYGGGYNERQGVEYKSDKEDSDGEFDDFGRKKKKFRSADPPPQRKEAKPEAEEDDESGDDGDLDAYKLDSDEEDEEEDDGDLSKYDFGEDDELPSSKPPTSGDGRKDRGGDKVSKSSSPARRSGSSSSSSRSSQSRSSSGSSYSGSRSRSRSRSRSNDRKYRRQDSGSRQSPSHEKRRHRRSSSSSSEGTRDSKRRRSRSRSR